MKKFIAIIRECISSFSYSILLIRPPFEKFTPTGGLRWEDPLSPYLFIMGAEVLSQMMIEVENEGKNSRG